MSDGELILYTAEDGSAAVQLRAEGGTVWLTQLEMATLFDTSKQNISLHIKNILAEGELAAAATVKESLTVQTEGRRKVHRSNLLYNLDMILAVGYRVRSPRGTQFRQWATTHLREYLVKGFVLDDERLKEPGGSARTTSTSCSGASATSARPSGASTRRSRDIYATPHRLRHRTPRRPSSSSRRCRTSCTGPSPARPPPRSSPGAPTPAQPNMGLTTWKSAPGVRKSDVTVAKNYLNREEIEELEPHRRRCTSTTPRTRPAAASTMTMREWDDKLDAFLQFNEREVLTHAGKVCVPRWQRSWRWSATRLLMPPDARRRGWWRMPRTWRRWSAPSGSWKARDEERRNERSIRLLTLHHWRSL